MKKKFWKWCFPPLVLLLTLQIGISQIPNTKTNKYQSVAEKIVNYNLEVSPGELVLISGTPHEIDLMAELQVAVAKVGGLAYLDLSIPEANKRTMLEMPMSHLSQIRTLGVTRARIFDCFIDLSSDQDPTLFSDVPEERFAAWRKGGAAEAEANRRARYRSVSLGQVGGIPTPAYAKLRNADFTSMDNMFWAALDTDYEQMIRKGKQIAGLIAPGKSVKVTSPNGTNLTFRISGSPAGMNTGKTSDNIKPTGPANVWLPAGEVYACIAEESAYGVMVVPSMPFRGKTIKNLRLSFANGKLTDVSADQNGEMIKKAIKMSSEGANVLSLFDIGLNPNCQMLPGSDYVSWEMAGMVTLGIGNNAWAGRI